MDNYSLRIIQTSLKKAERKRNIDKVNFEKWNCGAINLSTCKKLFCMNNRIPEEKAKMITDDFFVGWLKGLGYFHGLQNIQK